MPLWTNEQEAGVWGIKGNIGNSQGNEKEQSGKQTLSRTPETTFQRGQFCLAPSVCHT